MAFTFAFTQLSSGVDPPNGVGASIGVGNITVTGSTFTIPAHTDTITVGAYNTTSWPTEGRAITGTVYYDVVIGSVTRSYYPSVKKTVAQGSGWQKANGTVSQGASSAINTSSVFTSSNKTSRTVAIVVRSSYRYSTNDYSGGGYASTTVNLTGSATVTLNAPPTFTATTTSSAPYYANVSTYKVNITNLSAKYGGTISSAVLTVGNQTASRTTNGELSIALNATGTFTPSVKVTDSRGQVTTTNLSAITVSPHTAPTVTTQVSSTAPYYTTGTTYSVAASDPVIHDNVPISSISLTIGNQTISNTTVGQLSISPNTAGTFIPTVTVTDTAGASSVTQLPAITVNRYSAPTLNGSVIRRTESDGKPNEEDKSAVIGYQISWVEDLGHIQKPKLYIDDSQTEATATWYKTYDPTSSTQTYLSNPISDWDTITSGDVVYALITNAFLIENSYVINATVTDDYATSAVLSMTLPQAFFTVDFLAGGHGIAFGKLATDEGFECNMDAQFNNDLVAQDMTAQEVSDFVDSVGGGTGAIADKVVEQGTSGMWTYRKWASGIAECWGNTGDASRSITNSFGGQYYADLFVSLPSGLFTSITSAVSTRADFSGTHGNLVSISIAYATTTILRAYIYCQVSTTTVAGFSFEVKGRWK